MKILVFSDAHNTRAPMRAALQAHPDAEAVVFLGDGALDAIAVLQDFPTLPRCILRGNCDSRLALSAAGAELGEETVLDFGGLRFFCLHGHTQNVKSGYTRLLYRASELHADAVLFGHTHIPENEAVPDLADGERRILFFNPGTIGVGVNPTYGVIHVVNGVISAGHGHA